MADNSPKLSYLPSSYPVLAFWISFFVVVWLYNLLTLSVYDEGYCCTH